MNKRTIPFLFCLISLLSGCSIFDDEQNRVEVCCVALRPGETFSLFLHDGSAVTKAGVAVARYGVTDLDANGYRTGALSAASLDEGFWWSGKGTAKFFALQGADEAVVNAGDAVVGPLEIAPRWSWRDAPVVPRVAGIEKVHRGEPVCLTFSPATTTVTLVFPPLDDGVIIREVGVLSTKTPVCGSYMLDLASGTTTLADGPLSGNRIAVDLHEAVPGEDGDIVVTIPILPRRYRELMYSVMIEKGDISHAMVCVISEEPYGRIVEPYTSTTMYVPIPDEFRRQEPM